MKLNVSVIGCGDMGGQHARAWQAFPGARVVSLYDPDQARCEQLAAAVKAAACTSLEHAVLHPDVTVVSVCTPAACHADTACFALAHGRHVLCEKPLTLTLAEADCMIAAAEKSGCKLATSFQYRGFSRFRRLQELFRAGAFGEPLVLSFSDIREVRPKLAMHRRSMNGGPVIDMVSHYFDLLRFITGDEPTRVYAQGHVFGLGKPRLAAVTDHAIDAAGIEVTTARGHLLRVLVNWGMPEGFPGFGEELAMGPLLCARPRGAKLELRSGQGAVEEDLPPDDGPGPTVRIRDLAAAIAGAPQEVTGADGRRALQLSLAALESIETGVPAEV